MRFSFWISTNHTWDEVLDLATHAEATGWDGLWVADHFMPNDDNALDDPMQECLALLAALAAAVPRVRLGSLVLIRLDKHNLNHVLGQTADKMAGYKPSEIAEGGRSAGT